MRTSVEVPHLDQLFIGGEWVSPSSDETFQVVDPATEEPFIRVPLADTADIRRATESAREAFDEGPWPRLTHRERAEYLRALAAGIRARGADIAQISPRESGSLYTLARTSGDRTARNLESYADLADTFEFEERVEPKRGGNFALLVREPVGVVAGIVTWNSPMGGVAHKAGPALLAGCTVILKLPPEAPGEGYVVADVAKEIGLPPGVLSIIAADRDASEALVADPRVDKVSFTGSTATGRRIAAVCSERIARVTLELGGKSAAVVLDDADIAQVASNIATDECRIAGQVCSSLTRVIVGNDQHDELADALATEFGKVVVGDPFDPETQMGPVATSRQRDRVESYIEAGLADGATLVTGGQRPAHLDRGWYVEPTVFANVDNSSRIAQEEIFGPVICVIAAKDEDHAVALANDTIYGLNASVYTADADKARDVARRLRSGTVGHNAWRTDFDLAVGGVKQSGIGRQGGREGLLEYLETKAVILDATPTGYTTAGEH